MPKNNVNYYEVLGLPKNVKPDKVIKRFNEILLKLANSHSSNANALREQARVASEVLSDPGKKSAYDAMLRIQRKALVEVRKEQKKERNLHNALLRTQKSLVESQRKLEDCKQRGAEQISKSNVAVKEAARQLESAKRTEVSARKRANSAQEKYTTAAKNAVKLQQKAKDMITSTMPKEASKADQEAHMKSMQAGKLPNNHYQTLGLPKNASVDKIRSKSMQALKNIANSKGRMSEQHVERINKAVEILNDPQRRRTYDSQLKSQRNAMTVIRNANRAQNQVKRLKGRMTNALTNLKNAQTHLTEKNDIHKVARLNVQKITQVADGKVKLAKANVDTCKKNVDSARGNLAKQRQVVDRAMSGLSGMQDNPALRSVREEQRRARGNTSDVKPRSENEHIRRPRN